MVSHFHSNHFQYTLTLVVTSYVTSTGSTMHKPIWNTEMPGYPCYVCEMSKAGLPAPSSKFLTVTAVRIFEFTPCLFGNLLFVHCWIVNEVLDSES
jgi:hypothetical protein